MSMTHCFLLECYTKTHIDDLGLYLYFYIFSLRFVNVLYTNMDMDGWIRQAAQLCYAAVKVAVK